MRALRYVLESLSDCQEFLKDLFLTIDAVFIRWAAWSTLPVRILVSCLRLAFAVACFVAYLAFIITFLVLCFYPIQWLKR